MFFHCKYLLMVILLLTASAWSGIEIRGIVQNAETGEVLTGVNIILINTSKGTTSDADGYFKMEVENMQDAVLEFQYMGFTTKRLKLKGTNDWLEVKLLPEMLRSEPVIVTGVRAEKRKSPVPFTSLSKEYIKENYGAQDVPMLLKEIPGVYAYSDNGTGIGYSYLKIRGFDAKRVSVMINGIPHNDPEEHSVYWVDMPDLAESATSLQVQRGVGISPYAVSSFGGSVNLLTTGIPIEFGPEVTFGIGSYHTRKYMANLNTRLKDNYYATFRLSKINTDGYRDRSGVDLWSYYFKLVRTGEKSFTQLNIYGGNEKTHAAWEGSPESKLEKNHRHNPYTYHNYIDNFFQPHFELINKYEISENWNVNNTLFYIHGNGYYEQLKTGENLWEYGLTAADGDQEGDLIRQKWVEKDQVGYISEVNWNFISDQKLSLGTYLSTYQSDHHGEIEQLFNLSNPNVDLPYPEFEYYRYNYEKQNYNFYLKEEGRFNKKINWQFNLFMQNIDFKFKHQNMANFTGENRHAFNVNYTFVSPRFGLNFNLNKNFNAYISVSGTTREPSADDIFNGWYAPDDLGIAPLFTRSDTVYKNNQIDHIQWEDPQIEEEKLIDYEAGVAYIADKFNVELNLFRMYFKDEIVALSMVDDEGRIINGNADQSIHEGIELSLFARPHEKIMISSGISYSNNYFEKFLQPEIIYNDIWEPVDLIYHDYSDNKIAGFPDWQANSTLFYHVRNVKLALTHRFVGRIYLDNTESNSRSIEPLNTLFDARIILDIPRSFFKSKTQLILQVNNLLNKKYYTGGYYDSWIGENSLLPAATRNFLITLRMNM